MDLLREIHISGGAVVKNPSANAGDARDTGSIPGTHRNNCGAWGGGHHGAPSPPPQSSTSRGVRETREGKNWKHMGGRQAPPPTPGRHVNQVNENYPG